MFIYRYIYTYYILCISMGHFMGTLWDMRCPWDKNRMGHIYLANQRWPAAGFLWEADARHQSGLFSLATPFLDTL
jgi:hypothetical protein